MAWRITSGSLAGIGLAGISLARISLALAATAYAQTSAFFEKAFANVADGAPCYARAYDDTHLAAHPEQTVRAIAINMVRVNESDIPNTPERFELGFGLKVKKSEEWFVGAAICQAAATHADCFIEGDGGRFQLSPLDDGALRLVTGDYGIALEGETDFVQIDGTKGDDRVFHLKPDQRAVCDAAKAEPPRPQP